MIQYNNFLMKREQSRAGSRFAECEKSRLKAKILITLALLLTAVTGAWAQDVATPVISGETEFYDEVTVTITCASSGVDIYYTLDGSDPRGDHPAQIDYNKAFTLTETTTVRAAAYSGNGWSAIAEVTFTKLTGPTWDAATKTGTFSMPGSDVVLTPQYAPAAQLDENGAPAAVSGLEIAADAAIITAGQSAQGTLLYAVGTSETEKPALTAFSATLPNAKDQTAAGTYYVWYYIQGHDTPQGQEPSADNTFNDSEIMGPVTVELLTNEHTLNIKQSPNITVTVAGTPKTPTDDKVTPVTTGQEVKIKANTGYKFRKVEVKKGGAAAALAPALENGATVVIICNWGYDTTTFTYTNNGGTFSGQASGLDAGYFHNGLELNGKNLSFGASNVDNSEYLSVGITFNTESSAYSYTGKGEDFASFTISVNGTDVTDQLTELK